MKYLPIFIISFVFLTAQPASAQYASQKDAAYIATLKAVTDFKINDEENLKTMDKLREDKKFNAKLQKMIDQLSNQRSKTGKNRRVYEILKQAGKDIYDELS